MKAFNKLFWQVAIAGVVVLVGVGAALAATPSSSMKVIDARTTSKDLTLAYNVSGDGGTVSQVDLYLKKDDGPWQEVLSSFDPSAPFNINVDSYGGDGTYAFYTIAHLSTGEVEVKGVAEVTTVVDTVTPPSPDLSLIYINQAAAGLNTNEVNGHNGAAEAYSVVDIYGDAALTQKLGSAGVDANGAWGPVAVGPYSNHPYIWLTATDRNGNRSVASSRLNMNSYPEKVDHLIAASYTGEMLDLSFDPAFGADHYVIYYRHAGGAVWSAEVETSTTTPKLTNLEAGRAYDIRVAPVNPDGNVGQFTFITTRTAGTRVDDVPLPNVAVGGDTLSPVVVATETTAATTKSATAKKTTTAAANVSNESTTTASQATSSTDQNNTAATTDQSQSTSDQTPANNNDQTATSATSTDQNADQSSSEEPTEQSGSSATPWVILAILIILAGIATGGYFYWFSGPEEVTTTVKPDDKDEEDKRW